MIKKTEFKVGVVMSYWKKDDPHYLDISIRSIINQTFKVDSFIIIRDGNVSKSLSEIVQVYLKKGLLKEYKLKLNRGRGFARDFGIKKCKCDYIAIMDSDDISDRDRIKNQVNYLFANKECGLVGGVIEEFNYSLDITQKRNVPLSHSKIVEKGKFIQPFNHVTIMFKKDIYIKSMGYGKQKFIEDYFLYFSLYLAGVKFHNLDKVLVRARLPDKGIRNTNFNYLIEEIELQIKMYKNKYINFFEFFVNILKRLAFRFLPSSIRYFITRKILRTLNN